MYTGLPSAHRETPKESNGSRRPVAIEKLEMRRQDEAIELRFDLRCEDMWRHPRGVEPGNHSALWLFVKYRSTLTTTSHSADSVMEVICPSEGLPEADAAQARERARKHLQDGFCRSPLHGALPPREAGLPRLATAPGARAEGLRMLSGRVSRGAPAFEVPRVPGWLKGAAGAAGDGGSEVLRVLRKRAAGGGIGSAGGGAGHQEELLVIRRSEGGSTVYDVKSPSNWTHARLSPRPEDHEPPEGGALELPSDGMGAFLYRAEDNPGAGPVRFEKVSLRWLPPEDIEFPVSVWVHAIEMVYIPEGSFELGDPKGPKGPSGCFYSTEAEGEGEEARWTWRVRSEDAIPVAVESTSEAPRCLSWDTKGQNGELADIPASFPKGHKAFYMMRRQLTQGEFADFINSVAGNAKTSRYPYGGQGEFRYTVFKTDGGYRTSTRPNRANNWMSWADALSWCWWAGLRPMTELEYEKAARGFAPAVASEYAWGTTVMERAEVILGDESERELVTGNCNVDNVYSQFRGGDAGQGPVRDDALLRSGTPAVQALGLGGLGSFPEEPGSGAYTQREAPDHREATGASYFGVMALSGNLWEFVITAGNDRGRAFRPVNGDGQLNAVGLPAWCEEHDPGTAWPQADAEGTGFRGGSWYTTESKALLASRAFGAGLEGYNTRSHDTGFRGVRYAGDAD